MLRVPLDQSGVKKQSKTKQKLPYCWEFPGAGWGGEGGDVDIAMIDGPQLFPLASGDGGAESPWRIN